ncbi:MAG: DUF1223 domain-containing protein [Paracoccaceae bacterium]|nr:DUF1223 domain-containing protein [Paracoccaceae bacterium]
MRYFENTVCGIFLVVAGMFPLRASFAAEPVVVELFTSQGCSSCPPADDYLARLADDPQVIALALHVDYWDYIGWKDQFASPAFTERQRDYARAAETRSVYTPQMVVSGKDQIEGFKSAKVDASIRDWQDRPQVVTLATTRHGDNLQIHAETGVALVQPLRVFLVRYAPSRTVSIDRGENAGRTMVYRNIVTSWESLGHWTGDAPLDMQVPVSGDAPLVVILQEDGPGRIYAASRLE